MVYNINIKRDESYTWTKHVDVAHHITYFLVLGI